MSASQPYWRQLQKEYLREQEEKLSSRPITGPEPNPYEPGDNVFRLVSTFEGTGVKETMTVLSIDGDNCVCRNRAGVVRCLPSSNLFSCSNAGSSR